jgi:iron complex outermembrane receptor protein
VINIITKSSKDTHGIYADVGGGDQHRAFGDFRVGGKSGELNWRAYGMAMADATGSLPLPAIAADNPDMQQGGFRTDWTPTKIDTVTFEGDFFRGLDNQAGAYTPPTTQTPPMICRKTMFMLKWARAIDEDNDWAMETYYNDPFGKGTYVNVVDTYDVDFQYHFKRNRHDIVWGVGYRNSNERWGYTSGAFGVYDSEQIPNCFVQDTITLVDDKVFATVGSKFDYSSVTYFDYQPTARLVWTPEKKTSIWGAITRTIRTPSLIERVFITPGAEDALSYEMGFRRQPSQDFFWELATFFNRYDNLLGSQYYYLYQNVGHGDTYGFEYNATYSVTPTWRLTGSYSMLIEDFQYPTGYNADFVQGGTPHNRVYFQSGWDLSDNVKLDVMFRYVDSLFVGVNEFLAADIRLAWCPRKNLELSVVGQNLLAGRHYEFVTDTGATPTEVEPGVYGMVAWRY